MQRPRFESVPINMEDYLSKLRCSERLDMKYEQIDATVPLLGFR